MGHEEQEEPRTVGARVKGASDWVECGQVVEVSFEVSSNCTNTWSLTLAEAEALADSLKISVTAIKTAESITGGRVQ